MRLNKAYLFSALLVFPLFWIFADDTKVVFLEKSDAARILTRQRDHDYFDLLSKAEVMSRLGTIKKFKNRSDWKEWIKGEYGQNTLDFTTLEKQVIEKIVRPLITGIKRVYPKMGALDWRFIKVSNRVEAGLPHTVKRSIVLSEMVCKHIVQSVRNSRNGSKGRLAWIKELLIHEQIHVFQRANPTIFDPLYRDQWGFIKAQAIKRGSWLRKHQLHNPDDVHRYWVFEFKQNGAQRYIWPCLLLKEGDGLKRMPGDFRLVGVELKKRGDGFGIVNDERGIPLYQSLFKIEPYRKRFKFSYNIYSPDELLADLMAKNMMLRVFSDHGQAESKMARRFLEFLGPMHKWLLKTLK